MKALLLHHALPLFGILLLSGVIAACFTPVGGFTPLHGVALGVAGYVLGVQVGRQTDPLRPRYLQLRMPKARETAHIILLVLLSAAVVLIPAAWFTRDGYGAPDTSTGWTAIVRTFLNLYWGPIILALLALTCLTRVKQRESSPAE